MSSDASSSGVRFETTMGAFVVELYHAQAPKTCQNFAELAKRGYYDGVTFHRIVKDFVVQGGDPTGTGKGGESIYGGKFADEITRELKHTGASVMKNWLPFVLGPALAIERMPAPVCFNSRVISSANLPP